MVRLFAVSLWLTQRTNNNQLWLTSESADLRRKKHVIPSYSFSSITYFLILSFLRTTIGYLFTLFHSQGVKVLHNLFPINWGDVGGQSALALRLLLATVSNRLSSSAGVATGEEVSLTDAIMDYNLQAFYSLISFVMIGGIALAGLQWLCVKHDMSMDVGSYQKTLS